jgi:hypothetical protein
MTIEDGSVISQSAIDQEKARQERWSTGQEPATSGMPLPTPIRGEMPVQVGHPPMSSDTGQNHLEPGQIDPTGRSGQRTRQFDPRSTHTGGSGVKR